MARLRLLTPMPELAQRFPLDSPMIRIGRELDNDIVLPHPTVSRYHAVIQINREGIHIEDRGSSNGTYHNGEKVERAWLMPGDRLFIGKMEFKIEDDQMEYVVPEAVGSQAERLTQLIPTGRQIDRKILITGAIGVLVLFLFISWWVMSR